MKMKHLTAAAALAFLSLTSTAASAAVTYTFSSSPISGYQGTNFSFTVADYITTPTTITAFDTCNVGFIGAAGTATGGTCDEARFYQQTSSSYTLVLNGFTSKTDFGVAFEVPSLTTDGTYLGGTFPNSLRSTLTIASVSGAVPEPATWAMMLLGFGAIGASMRRRKRPVSTSIPQVA